MVTVYRYEHPDTKFGPYNHRLVVEDDYTLIDDEFFSEMDWKHRNRLTLPAIVGGDALGWRSGCLSLEGLKKWFRGYNRRLVKEYGFRVVAYEVPEDAVIHADGQVAFRYLRGLTPTPARSRV